jgi:hypothetical protein
MQLRNLISEHTFHIYCPMSKNSVQVYLHILLISIGYFHKNWCMEGCTFHMGKNVP